MSAGSRCAILPCADGRCCRSSTSWQCARRRTSCWLSWGAGGAVCMSRPWRCFTLAVPRGGRSRGRCSNMAAAAGSCGAPTEHAPHCVPSADVVHALPVCAPGAGGGERRRGRSGAESTGRVLLSDARDRAARRRDAATPWRRPARRGADPDSARLLRSRRTSPPLSRKRPLEQGASTQWVARPTLSMEAGQAPAGQDHR